MDRRMASVSEEELAWACWFHRPVGGLLDYVVDALLHISHH